MAIWWVFQGDSYARSREGGYLWAPLLNKAGKKVSHWESVDKILEGDMIISSAGGKIIALSVAKTAAFPSPQPSAADAEKWGFEGRRVDVAYIDIPQPVPIEEIKELFLKEPYKNSPIDQNGRGVMGYMFPVPERVAAPLLERINKSIDVEAAIAAGISSSAGPVETDLKEALTLVRIGQDTFRNGLVQIWQGKCCVTGISERQLLVASHIKPWSFCNRLERGDLRNGLLLEVRFDKLFDRGFITFDSDGQIRVSPQLSLTNRQLLGISGQEKIRGLQAGTSDYLKYHATQRFKET